MSPELHHYPGTDVLTNALDIRDSALLEATERSLVADYQAESPMAVACFQDDFEACIAHLRLPVTHRRATRTSKLLEQLLLEERRRAVKITRHRLRGRRTMRSLSVH